MSRKGSHAKSRVADEPTTVGLGCQPDRQPRPVNLDWTAAIPKCAPAVRFPVGTALSPAGSSRPRSSCSFCWPTGTPFSGAWSKSSRGSEQATSSRDFPADRARRIGLSVHDYDHEPGCRRRDRCCRGAVRAGRSGTVGNDRLCARLHSDLGTHFRRRGLPARRPFIGRHLAAQRQGNRPTDDPAAPALFSDAEARALTWLAARFAAWVIDRSASGKDDLVIDHPHSAAAIAGARKSACALSGARLQRLGQPDISTSSVAGPGAASPRSTAWRCRPHACATTTSRVRNRDGKRRAAPGDPISG
jgi:hypothetical protein